MNEAPALAGPRPHDTAATDRWTPPRRPIASGIALAVVVATAALAAIALHRNGHTQGDDFALYIRQARSLFDGDIAQVVADNRFTVLNSSGPFSPIAYPWGWPLLLSPFVHLWGYDYDRLKLLEVACFCIWLVLIHGIVRRRAGRLLALAVTAVVATAPILLGHTDQLLSEYPHVLAVAVFVWWLDRVVGTGRLIDATGGRLVVLGVLAAAAYNVRREGVVLLGVIAAAQLVELARGRRREGPLRPLPWRTIGTPYLAFAVSAILFQLLLPSMLMPDNGDSPRYVLARMGDYASVLTEQLGIGPHPAIGVAVLLLAASGMIVACVRRPRLNVPLAALTVLSGLAVSTHFRMVGRYYFQITPWIVYFAATAVAGAVVAITRLPSPRLGAAVAAVPLAFLVGVHAVVLPGDIADARDFDRSGRQQIGPTDASIAPVFAAVDEYTPPGAVVTFYRARTMTLYTDRRSIQTTSVERMLQSSDYYAQMRNSDYSQPALTVLDARALGLEEVWSDARWILWQVPPFDPPEGVGG